MKKIIITLCLIIGSITFAQNTNIPPLKDIAIPPLKAKANIEDATAQFNLGVAYYLGKGVEQSYSKAVYWYRKAAEQVYAKAQLYLGAAYDNGEGVEQSHSQAVYWYKKAAEQGLADAQYNLGVAYYYGGGVKKSKSQALYWLRKACNNQNNEACDLLNKIK